MIAMKKIQVGSYTIVGDRLSQQDAMHVENNIRDGIMAAICDGMGGMQGGERASSVSIETILNRFRQEPPAMEMAGQWIEETFAQADAKVASLTAEEGRSLGGGSTGIVVVTDRKFFQWGCVGDSRIYLLRGGTLYTLTRMHNYNLQLQELLESGRISREEMQRQAVQGEALISFLGIGGLPLIDTGLKPVLWEEGDVLVLCSDGLYKSLDDQQIQAIVEESGGHPGIMAKRLCEEADRLKVKKQDNTTVIALRCSE